MTNLSIIIFYLSSFFTPELEVTKATFENKVIHAFFKNRTTLTQDTKIQFQLITFKGIEEFETVVGPGTVSVKVGNFDKEECFVLMGKFKGSKKGTVIFTNTKNSTCDMQHLKNETDKKFKRHQRQQKKNRRIKSYT